jgi:RNA polymerase sigma-70 factor (ECF subfamily)
MGALALNMWNNLSERPARMSRRRLLGSFDDPAARFLTQRAERKIFVARLVFLEVSHALRSGEPCPDTVMAMDRAPRDNAGWVRAIADDGAEGEAARGELRGVLLAGLLKVLTARGADQDLCEDVAQETLLRVRERLGLFRGDSRFTTWALSIAMRIAFDELRHRRWRDASFEAMTEGARSGLVFEPRVEATQERSAARDRVLRALAEVIEGQLTEKQRSVLAAELEGMPHVVVAARLGMKQNALYKLSHDARKSVKAHLEARGIGEAEVLWVFE